MNERLWEYALTVSEYLFDGISSPRFMRMKAFEFMHLLQFYYARELLTHERFSQAQREFEGFLGREGGWRENRIAAIAGLSTSRFGVKFKEVFGTSPYQWMMSRKSEQIYHKLVYGSESLREISEEFRFGSVQHFNDFCKKRFGMTPGKLRSQKRAEVVAV